MKAIKETIRAAMQPMNSKVIAIPTSSFINTVRKTTMINIATSSTLNPAIMIESRRRRARRYRISTCGARR